MPSQTAHILINTGSRRGQSALRQITKTLRTLNVTVTATHHLKPGVDVAKMADTIIKAKPDTLLLCGGDGTMSSVLQHFVHTKVPIGIVPLGTTNNFAKSLKIPHEIPDAVTHIINSKPKPVDLGKFADMYFANVVGIGLSARIAGSVSDAIKKRFGRAAYAIVGLQQMLTHKPFMVTVQDKDNELRMHFETHQVIVANGRYHAGKIIAQDAQVDNHELIVFALGGRSKLSFAWHMIDYYLGRKKQVAHSSYLLAKDIRLLTSSPQAIEIDGEIKQTSTLHFAVAPGAVRIRH